MSSHHYIVLCCVCVFFFFKQKTAYEMRISDWSSDVCSSDLIAPALDTLQALTRDNPDQQVRIGVVRTNVKLRMDEVDRIMAGTSSADGVERLVTRYPIRDIAAEIVSEERILLGQRTAVADKDRKSTRLNSSH